MGLDRQGKELLLMDKNESFYFLSLLGRSLINVLNGEIQEIRLPQGYRMQKDKPFNAMKMDTEKMVSIECQERYNKHCTRTAKKCNSKLADLYQLKTHIIRNERQLKFRMWQVLSYSRVI